MPTCINKSHFLYSTIVLPGVSTAKRYSNHYLISRAKLIHWNGHMKPWKPNCFFPHFWFVFRIPDPRGKYKPNCDANSHRQKRSKLSNTDAIKILKDGIVDKNPKPASINGPVNDYIKSVFKKKNTTNGEQDTN